MKIENYVIKILNVCLGNKRTKKKKKKKKKKKSRDGTYFYLENTEAHSFSSFRPEVKMHLCMFQ